MFPPLDVPLIHQSRSGSSPSCYLVPHILATMRSPSILAYEGAILEKKNSCPVTRFNYIVNLTKKKVVWSLTDLQPICYPDFVCKRSHAKFLYFDGVHTFHISFAVAETILPLNCAMYADFAL